MVLVWDWKTTHWYISDHTSNFSELHNQNSLQLPIITPSPSIYELCIFLLQMEIEIQVLPDMFFLNGTLSVFTPSGWHLLIWYSATCIREWTKVLAELPESHGHGGWVSIRYLFKAVKEKLGNKKICQNTLNYTPEDLHRTWKWWFGRWLSFSRGPIFSGSSR